MRFPPPKPGGGRSGNLALDLPSYAFPDITIRPGQVFYGTVLNRTATGVFVRFADKRITREGFLPGPSLKQGQLVEVRIAKIQKDGNRILIGLEFVGIASRRPASAPPLPPAPVRPNPVPPLDAPVPARAPAAASSGVKTGTVGGGRYSSSDGSDDYGGLYIVVVGGGLMNLPRRLMPNNRVDPPSDSRISVIPLGIFDAAGHEFCCTAGFAAVAEKLLDMIVSGKKFTGNQTSSHSKLFHLGRSLEACEGAVPVQGGDDDFIAGEYLIRAFYICVKEMAISSTKYVLRMEGIGPGSSAMDLIKAMAERSLLAVPA